MVKPHAYTTGPRFDVDGHPLADYVDVVLAEPALRDAFRATFEGTLSACIVGFPRMLSKAALAGWVKPSDTVVELARMPAREPFELGLLLHAESAVRLVDRVLGGPGDSAITSAAGAPSDAECGVLAYAAARLCAARDPCWVVRDVRCDVLASLSESDALVHWPLTLQSSFGPLSGALLFSRSIATRLAHPHVLELLVRDRLDPLARDDLAVDDVLVGDGWALTDAVDGLTGTVTLAIPDGAVWLAGELARSAVRASGTCTIGPDALAELVLARLSVRFEDLARLGGGEPLTLPPLGNSPALLRAGGRAIAEGALIMHRGALGLRVTALFDP